MPFFTSPKQGVSGDNFPENFHHGKQFTAFFVVPKIGRFGRKSWKSWLWRAVLRRRGMLCQRMAFIDSQSVKTTSASEGRGIDGEGERDVSGILSQILRVICSMSKCACSQYSQYHSWWLCFLDKWRDFLRMLGIEKQRKTLSRMCWRKQLKYQNASKINGLFYQRVGWWRGLFHGSIPFVDWLKTLKSISLLWKSLWWFLTQWSWFKDR